jgi:hypothetical protein
MHFGAVNVEDITDVDIFRKNFFPEGFDTEDAGLTVSGIVFVMDGLLCNES